MAAETKATMTCRTIFVLLQRVPFFLVLVQAYLPVPPSIQRSDFRIRRFVCSMTADGSSEVVPGKIPDVATWLRWTSESLKNAHGISLLEALQVENWQEIDDHERYAVLSHGVQEDPIFCYSNVAARNTFGYSEVELYALPSRYSAPEQERNRRQVVMDQKNEDRFWIIASGIRQRKDQSLFEFRDVWLWNVYDDDGTRVGQSAVYDRNKIVECQ